MEPDFSLSEIGFELLAAQGAADLGAGLARVWIKL